MEEGPYAEYASKVFDSNDKIIFVNIKHSYDALEKGDVKNPFYRPSLYDCTVKYWRVADKKAYSATHIVGCYKGVIKEVVKISGVSIVSNGEYAGRKVFEGVEQLDSPYLGVDISKMFYTLANFNTKYYNL